MLSSHPYLGLPCDLLVRGFHLNIFLTVLVSGISRCDTAIHIGPQHWRLDRVHIPSVQSVTGFAKEEGRMHKEFQLQHRHCWRGVMAAC